MVQVLLRTQYGDTPTQPDACAATTALTHRRRRPRPRPDARIFDFSSAELLPNGFKF